MHFHMPKPIHGWRAFFGEVGIIVVGVLIALGAEQIVHNITEKRTTAEAQKRVSEELSESLMLGVERIAISPCLQDRLRKLSSGLATGRPDWSQFTLPAVGDARLALREVYHTPSRNWVDDAYRGALAQGDLSGASALERAQLASLYKQIESMRQYNQRENELTTRLAVLQFNPRLSSVERHQMVQTVAELDWINALMVLNAHQIVDRYFDLGGPYAWTAKEIEGTRDYWPQYLSLRAKVYGSCVDTNALDQIVKSHPAPKT